MIDIIVSNRQRRSETCAASQVRMADRDTTLVRVMPNSGLLPIGQRRALAVSMLAQVASDGHTAR